MAQDPRLPELGCRAVLASGSQPAAADAAVADALSYKRWRLELGVAEGDTEIPSGECRCVQLSTLR